MYSWNSIGLASNLCPFPCPKVILVRSYSGFTHNEVESILTFSNVQNTKPTTTGSSAVENLL